MRSERESTFGSISTLHDSFSIWVSDFDHHRLADFRVCNYSDGGGDEHCVIGSSHKGVTGHFFDKTSRLFTFLNKHLIKFSTINRDNLLIIC